MSTGRLCECNRTHVKSKKCIFSIKYYSTYPIYPLLGDMGGESGESYTLVEGGLHGGLLGEALADKLLMLFVGVGVITTLPSRNIRFALLNGFFIDSEGDALFPFIFFLVGVCVSLSSSAGGVCVVSSYAGLRCE